MLTKINSYVLRDGAGVTTIEESRRALMRRSFVLMIAHQRLSLVQGKRADVWCALVWWWWYCRLKTFQDVLSICSAGECYRRVRNGGVLLCGEI